MTSGRELVDRKTGEVITRENEPQPLTVTPGYIAQQQQSLALLAQLVHSVLVQDRDYGHIPGIPGEFLWDPGASLIIAAFNCHIGQRRVIHLVDDGKKIATVLEVPIISNTSGREVGTGIGAASTYETKNKYRWEENPKDFGYDDNAIKTLKTRQKRRSDGDTLEYRILNPEPEELLNVVVTIASKRAEVDAAKSLPGVGSALRDLFEGKGPARKEPDWKGFWGRVRQMSLLESDIYEMLEVKSMTDWLKQGKTLDDAIKAVAEKLATQGGKPKTPKEPVSPSTQAESHLKKPQRDPNSLKSIEQLARALKDDFGLTYEQQWKELNIESWNDLAITPADAYRQVAAVRQ